MSAPVSSTLSYNGQVCKLFRRVRPGIVACLHCGELMPEWRFTEHLKRFCVGTNDRQTTDRKKTR